ncbi:MAG: DUF308 domain-containing protein [Prevotella sp.]|nr:DUF308 domain-containing protein [Prevotella sp.]
MKILQSSFFRALTAIVVGVLLIKYPDNTVTGIVVAIGVLFLLSGIVSLLGYWNARRHVSEYTIYDAQGRQVAGQAPAFPLVGVGSIILGAILALMPETFISWLMYVIGAILILGAISQYMAIISARRYGNTSFAYWVCPTLILLVGLYVIIKPMAPLSTAMLILGWLTLFYGIIEAVNALLFARRRRQWEREQEQEQMAEAEEIIEPENEKEDADATVAHPPVVTPL